MDFNRLNTGGGKQFRIGRRIEFWGGVGERYRCLSLYAIVFSVLLISCLGHPRCNSVCWSSVIVA